MNTIPDREPLLWPAQAAPLPSGEPDRIPLRWSAGGKMEAIEQWSKSVLADPRLTKGEVCVAWALSFSFNNESGRSWELRSNIAKRVGLSETYVSASIAGLDKKGHIVRADERIGGRLLQGVIRPALSRTSVRQEPRKRRGGIHRSDRNAASGGTEPQFADGAPKTEVQYPCPPEPQYPCPTEVQGAVSLTHPREIHESASRVMAPGATEPAASLFDEEWEDDSFPEPWND